jgi:hypothetical protein
MGLVKRITQIIERHKVIFGKMSNYIFKSLKVIDTLITTKFIVLGNNIRINQSSTPSPTEGEIGEIRWDDNYLWVKTSTGWKKTNLT